MILDVYFGKRDRQRVTVASEIQKSAFLRCGWKEVKSEEKVEESEPAVAKPKVGRPPKKIGDSMDELVNEIYDELSTELGISDETDLSMLLVKSQKRL